MLQRLGMFGQKWAMTHNPWTNVYGLSRSLLALATALTLILNDVQILFRPSSGMMEFPYCEGNISIFCIVPNDYIYLNLIRWISVILLLIIASGWRPRVTGIIHWWISYSVQVSAITIDGGEQVTAVLTLLLLPITLTDDRKWHWERNYGQILSSQIVSMRIIALVSFVAIRFQIAILYFHSTAAKLFNPEWIDGTAVYYYLNDPMLGLPSLILNIINPVLTSSWVVVMTWGALILQTFLFLALFSPKRYWSYFLYGALIFHELIAVMLGLITFSISMCAALILYLRPNDMEFKVLYKLGTSINYVMKKILINVNNGVKGVYNRIIGIK